MRRLIALIELRRDEWPRFLVLYAIVLSANAGFLWGRSIVEAGFLTDPALGARALPPVLILVALTSIGISIGYTSLADRIAADRLLIGIYGCAAVLTACGSALLAAGHPGWAYLLLYPMLMIAGDILNVHWATYVSGFYDAQSAKRVLPILASASRVAVIAAGFLVPVLNAAFNSQLAILIIWCGTFVVSATLVRLMPRLAGATPPPPPVTALPAIASLRQGFRFVADTPLLRWMAAGTLTLSVLVVFITTRGSEVLQQHFAGAANPTLELSNLLALLNAVTNLVMLPILIFGLGRLIARIGLGNASLIFPGGNLLLCAWLVIAPGVASAAAATFNRLAFRLTIHGTIDSLLYNAVPPAMKARARGFINGLLAPVGTLVGGILALRTSIGAATAPLDWMPPVILALALALLLIALQVRRSYARALLALLQRDDLTGLLEQTPDGEVVIADPAALAVVRQRVLAAANPEQARFLMRLLRAAGGSEVEALLIEALRHHRTPALRAAILEGALLAGIGGRGARAAALEAAADAAPVVRAAALAYLQHACTADDPMLVRLAVQRLGDDDAAVMHRAVGIIGRSADQAARDAARQLVARLVAHPDAMTRARGISLLDDLRDAAALAQLGAALDDPDEMVRIAAAIALEDALGRDGHDPAVRAQILAQIPRLCADPVERLRLAAVALGAQGGPAQHAMLFAAASDPSDVVREAAMRALHALGPAVAPLARDQLGAADGHARRVALLVLAPVEPRTAAPPLQAEIGRLARSAQLDHERAAALRRWPATSATTLLADALAQRAQATAAAAFTLLAAQHGAETVAALRRALGDADEHRRADALEALESLTSPATARALQPAGTTSVAPIDAVQQLARDDATPWVRGLAVLVAAQRLAATPAADPAVPRARRRPADLLGALQAAPAADDQPRALRAIIDAAAADPDPIVRQAHATAQQRPSPGQEASMLSGIERMILLRDVPFFHNMTVEQLVILSGACDELAVAADDAVYAQGSPGGAVYVIVAGRIALEQEQRRGSSARIATLDAGGFFGEADLFDDAPRAMTALAIQPARLLRLRREPLLALMRRHPELSLTIIDVLSQRLRAADERIAELAPRRPRQLHQVFDRLE
ncbi:MAG: cyclic nucleotide-binding domain-containing protein [Chloroflexi bacterium]|nr:cyclic nucleotide-binding domain-containing protein [Chloroflexota bacterium]